MLSACSNAPVSKKEVVGSYSINKGSPKDEIEVFANGRYTHTYAPRGGAAVVDSGTWSLREYNGMRLFFENFRSWSRKSRYPNAVNGGEPPPALWPALVERSFSGELRLIVDSDQDWMYIKVK
jgi:hypothetical protein